MNANLKEIEEKLKLAYGTEFTAGAIDTRILIDHFIIKPFS